MGIQSDILNQFQALNNASNIPKFINQNNERVDNLGFVDFIFELLKLTRGKKDFEGVVLKGIVTDLKAAIDIDDGIKSILSEFLMCNVPIKITKSLTTLGNGIDIPIPEIDMFALLDIDPNGTTGRYFYEGNNINKDINYIFYKAQTATKENAINYIINESVLFSLYSPSANVINFSFGEKYENKFLNEWVDDYFNTIQFFNLPNFFSLLVDLITGVVSVTANKNEAKIREEYKKITLLQKLFGYCSEDNGNVNSPRTNLNSNGDNLDLDGYDFMKGLEKNLDYDNNPFSLSADELHEIAERAADLYNNQLRFRVCDTLLVPISASEVLAGLNTLYNPTDETNPDGSVTYNNENAELSADDINKLLDSMLQSGLQTVINDGEEGMNVNFPNFKLELELNILKKIPYAIMRLIISPKLLVVFKLGDLLLTTNAASANARLTITAPIGFNQFSIEKDKVSYFRVGNIVKVENTNDLYTIIDVTDNILFLNRPLLDSYIQNTKILNNSASSTSFGNITNLLEGIGNTIVDKILKNIFNILKKELEKFLGNILKKVILQRLGDYTAIMEYLIGLLKSLKGTNFKDCSSTLAQILSLLKLPQLPAIPMPPMLTLTTGALKPGMNEVVAINEMKSKLQKYGINTSQINSDGTPNTYILGLESVMSTLIRHIKTHSNVQSEVLTLTGPAFGYSQIQ